MEPVGCTFALRMEHFVVAGRVAVVESHLLYKWTMLIVPNLSLNHWLVTGGSKVKIYGTFTRVTAVRLLTLVTMGCAVTSSHYPPMQYYAIMYLNMALCDDMMI